MGERTTARQNRSVSGLYPCWSQVGQRVGRAGAPWPGSDGSLPTTSIQPVAAPIAGSSSPADGLSVAGTKAKVADLPSGRFLSHDGSSWTGLLPGQYQR